MYLVISTPLHKYSRVSREDRSLSLGLTVAALKAASYGPVSPTASSSASATLRSESAAAWGPGNRRCRSAHTASNTDVPLGQPSPPPRTSAPASPFDRPSQS